MIVNFSAIVCSHLVDFFYSKFFFNFKTIIFGIAINSLAFKVIQLKLGLKCVIWKNHSYKYIFTCQKIFVVYIWDMCFDLIKDDRLSCKVLFPTFKCVNEDQILRKNWKTRSHEKNRKFQKLFFPTIKILWGKKRTK